MSKGKDKDKERQESKSVSLSGAEALLNYLKSNTNKINASIASRLPAVLERIPSGIFAVDLATGGGLPRGKVSVLWGEWGSSKTTLALRFVSNALKLGKSSAVLWLDVEGSFNREWASKIGVNLDAVVIASPRSAEEALNIILEVAKDEVADFIVLDSIASLSPIAEKEHLVGEWQQGLLARLLGQFSRKYACDVLTKENAPTLLLINQVRERIVTFGNPLTRPGGKSIGFLSSLEIRLKEGKTIEKDDRVVMMEFAGIVNKNRFFKSGVEFSYRMVVDKYDGYSEGDVVEEDYVISLAKEVGFLRKEKGEYEIADLGISFSTLDAIKSYFIENKENFVYFKNKLFEFILEQGNKI